MNLQMLPLKGGDGKEAVDDQGMGWVAETLPLKGGDGKEVVDDQGMGWVTKTKWGKLLTAWCDSGLEHSP